ncbi:MAG: hypothetical protein ACD_37C00382G0003 [uncultured bacterium]|nr:MAG: hypothetical protein ACD_37C00382G0003 [uncultured bacterium]
MAIEQRIQSAEIYSISRRHFRPEPLEDLVLPADQQVSEELLHCLSTRERVGRTGDVLDTGEISLAVNLAEKNGIASELFGEIGLRIFEKTSFILTGQQVSRTYDGLGLNKSVRVVWGSPLEIEGEKIDGRYTHGKKLIEITFPYPTPAQRILSLASLGRITTADETYVHEQTHAVQLHGASGRISYELMEAQAYRTGQDTLAEFPHCNLVDHVIVKGKISYEHLDRRKFEAAVWFIDRFNALGLSQDDIAKLVLNPGAWIGSEGVWGLLEWELREEMLDKGLGNIELERAVMAGDLLKAIERHKARKIAQEVLYQRFKPEIEAWA